MQFSYADNIIFHKTLIANIETSYQSVCLSIMQYWNNTIQSIHEYMQSILKMFKKNHPRLSQKKVLRFLVTYEADLIHHLQEIPLFASKFTDL